MTTPTCPICNKELITDTDMFLWADYLDRVHAHLVCGHESDLLIPDPS